MLKAVSNVNTIITETLVGQNSENQEELDQMMIDLDGSENKSNLGANAILAVSLAIAKAAALSQNKPLYEYIGGLAGNTTFQLPLPMMNIINGGKHGGWAADLQEFMVFPVGATSFSEAIQMGAELFQALRKVLNDHGYSTAVGDEGGFAPPFKNGNQEPFDLMIEAIEKAGYNLGKDFVFGAS